MSSIAKFITGESIATTVHMVRKAQTVPRPVVLVEGDKDRRVIRSVLRSHADVIAGHGKETTLDSVNYVKIGAPENWLIIIVDADFDRILGVRYWCNVLMTDCHDMDCEHIRSPALEKVVQELCSDQKCQKAFGFGTKGDVEKLADAIRKSLLGLAMPIGLLRLVSLRKNLQLSFKTIDHSKIIDSKEPSVDTTKLCNIALAGGAKPGLSATALIVELSKEEAANLDPWQVCQGHDLDKLFVLAIRKFWGVGKLTTDEVERSLRLAYETAFFWHSALGESLIKLMGSMGVNLTGNL